MNASPQARPDRAALFVCVLGGWLCGAFAVRADSVPDPLQFATRDDAAPGSVQVSDAVTITGIDEAAPITVSGAHYSINGHAFTNSAGSAHEGDVLVLRTTASPKFSTTVIASAQVGGVSATFSITTAAAPTGVPTPLSFKLDELYVTEVAGLEPTKYFYVKPRSLRRSGTLRVQGLSGPAPISISGGSYRINSGPYTVAAGSVLTGDRVMVSATSPSTSNDALSATLTIGTRAASFNLYTTADAVAETPSALSGTQMLVVRDRKPVPQRAFVYRPAGWTAADRRTGFVYFFGGGWINGDPSKSVSWAKWAASKGMVGIAPDYRTNQRFSATPLLAVDDARATLRWAQDQASVLGIDPARIVVGGNSAGGHLALWAAIVTTPPGSSESTAPIQQPAATVLVSAVSDTSLASGYAPYRFGIYADALNPQAQLSPVMPPTIAFHGDADTTVLVTQSSQLCERLQAAGNVCQFVNVPGGNHSYRTQPGLPGNWKQATYDMIEQFLREQGLLP